jgi:hypothetical protein
MTSPKGRSIYISYRFRAFLWLARRGEQSPSWIKIQQVLWGETTIAHPSWSTFFLGSFSSYAGCPGAGIPGIKKGLTPGSQPAAIATGAGWLVWWWDSCWPSTMPACLSPIWYCNVCIFTTTYDMCQWCLQLLCYSIASFLRSFWISLSAAPSDMLRGAHVVGSPHHSSQSWTRVD